MPGRINWHICSEHDLSEGGAQAEHTHELAHDLASHLFEQT